MQCLETTHRIDGAEAAAKDSTPLGPAGCLSPTRSSDERRDARAPRESMVKRAERREVRRSDCVGSRQHGSEAQVRPVTGQGLDTSVTLIAADTS